MCPSPRSIPASRCARLSIATEYHAASSPQGRVRAAIRPACSRRTVQHSAVTAAATALQSAWELTLDYNILSGAPRRSILRSQEPCLPLGTSTGRTASQGAVRRRHSAPSCATTAQLLGCAECYATSISVYSVVTQRVIRRGIGSPCAHLLLGRLADARIDSTALLLVRQRRTAPL